MSSLKQFKYPFEFYLWFSFSNAFVTHYWVVKHWETIISINMFCDHIVQRTIKERGIKGERKRQRERERKKCLNFVRWACCCNDYICTSIIIKWVLQVIESKTTCFTNSIKDTFIDTSSTVLDQASGHGGPASLIHTVTFSETIPCAHLSSLACMHSIYRTGAIFFFS